MPEELGQLVRGGGEVNLVPRPENKVAGGDDGLSLPGHGADQHPDPDVPVQVRQGQAVQGGVGGEAVFHQLQPSLGEGFHLHGGGETEDPGNLPGGGPLGIDDHGEAQFVPHEAELLFIFRVADAGDGVADAQLFGHQAGEDVQLVAGGGGDEELRLFHLRLPLYAVDRAVSADPHDIVNINDAVDQPGVLVYDRDIVPVGGKLLGQGGAHLTRANDDDFHVRLLKKTGRGGSPRLDHTLII